MYFLRLLTAIGAAGHFASAANYTLKVVNESPYSISISNEENEPICSNSALLAGRSNDTVTAVGNHSNHTSVNADMISPTIARVQINSSLGYTGAIFGVEEGAKHYGVWGYPWNASLQNTDIAFDLKGLQSDYGVKYSSARSPFFISDTGYAVYTDTMSMGSYSFSSEDQEVQFIFNTTELVYYVILPTEEGDIKSILKQYASLTDTTALWSPTSYGPLFWHDDFESESGFPSGVNNSQEFVQDVVDKLFENRVRASTIMVDRPYGTGTEGWGNFDFDEAYWPDIEGLVANVSDHGMGFQVWAANRAVPESELYEESLKNNWLFIEMATEEEPSVALDLTIPEAYEYFKERMAYFPDTGIKGYKIDRGEEGEMPSWEQNIQSYLFHKLLYEKQAEKWGAPTETKPAGFYSFARNAVDRSRKYTGLWNGDTDSTFDGLLYSIKGGIRSGLIGFPMWGSDTGGYSREADEEEPTETLWARWMWFSTFSPVYELNLDEGSIPWYDYSEELVEVLRETTQLHLELVPFIQSYMFRATTDGLPIIRALFLETPEDERAWEIDDSYFFGEEFLVAPIVNDNGTADIYFPKGSKYLEYFGKSDVYEGGDEVTVNLDVRSIPVFVREGSIVPRGDIYQFNNLWEENWEPWLNIEAYPSYSVENSTFEHYNEDAGRAVEIRMEANGKNQEICVSYGQIGANGKLLVYVKDGSREVKLNPQGGKKCIRNVETLFG